MKVLDKYILKHFLVILVVSSLLSVLLFLLVSVLDSLGSLMVRKQMSLVQIVQYFSYQIPQMAYYAAPLSVLFGLLLTLSVLGARSELTVIRVSGASWWQITRWPLIFTIVYTWLIYLIGGYIIPLANQKSKSFESAQIEKESTLPGSNLWVFYRQDPEKQSAIYIKLYLPGRKSGIDQARGIAWFRLDSSFFPVREVIAERGYYLGGYEWLLFRARIFNYSRNSAPVIEKKFMLFEELPVKPKNFLSFQKWPGELSLPELDRQIRNLSKLGFDPREYRVEYASRSSVPVACLILFALALGLSIRVRRPQGIYLNLAWALVITFSYFAIMAECLSLGKSGKLPPLLSAWAGNILFAAVAVYLLRGRERE